jgi:hypothetical protein
MRLVLATEALLTLMTSPLQKDAKKMESQAGEIVQLKQAYN